MDLVIGVRYHYLADVCHDGDEKKAIETLKNVVLATFVLTTSLDLHILTDETVLPNPGTLCFPAGHGL